MINSLTYPLDEKNYYKEVYQKTQVVIGHSGRKDMRHYLGIEEESYKNIGHKKSNQLIAFLILAIAYTRNYAYSAVSLA